MTVFFIQAIKEGRIEEVSKWLELIAPDQLKETVNRVVARDAPFATAFVLAVGLIHLDIAKLLIDAGAGMYFESYQP